MDRVQQLVQFALAEADRQGVGALGITTLVKLVYLADVEHAARKGAPFTDAPWKFLHFGPWASSVQDALPSVGAESVALLGRPDVNYWKLELEPRAFAALDASLPIVCTSVIANSLKRFRADDAGLLEHVYRTQPMLHAAPGEVLSLSNGVAKNVEPAPGPQSAEITKKERRQLGELRQRIQERLKAGRPARRLVVPDPPPNYDAGFLEGVAWLDRLASEGDPPDNGTAKVSDDIWRSRGRTDLEDIP